MWLLNMVITFMAADQMTFLPGEVCTFLSSSINSVTPAAEDGHIDCRKSRDHPVAPAELSHGALAISSLPALATDLAFGSALLHPSIHTKPR